MFETTNAPPSASRGQSPRASGVAREQRFTRSDPCPICGGYDGMKRHGHGRCQGIRSDDRRYALCYQDLIGGHVRDTDLGPASWHLLDGPCRCGRDHHTSGGARPPAEHAHFTASRTPAQAQTKVTRTHLRYPPIATHEYRDADGALRFRVIRFWSGERPANIPDTLPKCMPQRPDGAGDWADGLDGMPYAGLYRLPELLAAPMHRPVFIVGGEKCADALAALGLVATCNAGGEGAGKWANTPARHDALRGRHAVILPDNDTPGREHAQAVTADLRSVAQSVRRVELPALPEHGDVYDWIHGAGGTAVQLLELAIAAPAQGVSAPDLDGESDGLREAATLASPAADPITLATVVNLRARDHAQKTWHLDLHANPNIPNRLKPLIAHLKQDWESGRQRTGAQGSLRVNRGVLSEQISMSKSTITRNTDLLNEAGLIRKIPDWDYDDNGLRHDHLSIEVTPLLLEDIAQAVVTVPPRGGARCKHCGSENLRHRIYCADCGTVQRDAPLSQSDDEKQPAQATESREQHTSAQSQNICPGTTLKQSGPWAKLVSASGGSVGVDDDADDAHLHHSHSGRSETGRTGGLWEVPSPPDDDGEGEDEIAEDDDHPTRPCPLCGDTSDWVQNDYGTWQPGCRERARQRQRQQQQMDVR